MFNISLPYLHAIFSAETNNPILFLSKIWRKIAYIRAEAHKLCNLWRQPKHQAKMHADAGTSAAPRRKTRGGGQGWSCGSSWNGPSGPSWKPDWPRWSVRTLTKRNEWAFKLPVFRYAYVSQTPVSDCFWHFMLPCKWISELFSN